LERLFKILDEDYGGRKENELAGATVKWLWGTRRGVNEGPTIFGSRFKVMAQRVETLLKAEMAAEDRRVHEGAMRQHWEDMLIYSLEALKYQEQKDLYDEAWEVWHLLVDQYGEDSEELPEEPTEPEKPQKPVKPEPVNFRFPPVVLGILFIP